MLTKEDDSVDVDTASLTFGPPGGAWSLTGGQLYVPFGSFETELLSDPLTVDIGETRQTALQLNLSSGGLNGSIFIFKGDSPEDGEDRVQGAGAAVGYSVERKRFELGLNLSYINDLGDSDALQDVIADTLGSNEVIDRAQGISASAKMRSNGITFLGEYLGALDEFHGDELAFGDYGENPRPGWSRRPADSNWSARRRRWRLATKRKMRHSHWNCRKKRILIGLSDELMDGVFWVLSGRMTPIMQSMKVALARTPTRSASSWLVNSSCHRSIGRPHGADIRRIWAWDGNRCARGARGGHGIR